MVDPNAQTCQYCRRSEQVTSTDKKDPNHSEESWECHRQTVSGSKYCMFHLSPDKRDSLGINAEDLMDEFLRSIESGQKVDKKFLGAHFENLILNHKKIKSESNYPIDLRGVTVDNKIDLEEAEINSPINLRQSNIHHLFADQATISEDILLDVSQIHKISFIGTKIHGDISATNMRVTGESCWDEGRFNGDTNMKGSHFEETTSFKGAEFSGEANLLDDDVCFENTVFESSVHFKKAIFRYADFCDAIFKSNADFTETRFHRDAEFKRSEFFDESIFSGAEFEGGDNVVSDDADFEHATFHKRALFDSTKFRHADFHEAEFKTTVRFEEAEFVGDADFQGVETEGEICFSNSHFSSDANFENSVFCGEVDFSETQFHDGDTVANEEVNFKNALFKNKTNFSSVDFPHSNFTASTFQSEAIFNKVIFRNRVLFDRCEFKGKTIFKEARYADDADYSDTKFAGEVQFDGAEFRGGNGIDNESLSLENTHFEHGAQFRHVQFQDLNGRQLVSGKNIDFSKCVFNDSVVLSDCDIDGQLLATKSVFGNIKSRDTVLVIDGCDISGEVNFTDAWISGIDSSNGSFGSDVIFTETWFDDSVKFNQASFSQQANFDHVTFDSTADFSDCEFTRLANFEGSEFHGGEHSLDDAKFEGSEFSEARFSEVDFQFATFSSSTFSNGLEFNNSQCSGEFEFKGAEISDVLEIKGSEFGGDVSIEISLTDDADLTDTLFRENVNLTVTAPERRIIIDMSNSLISGGKISHKGDIPPLYDFTKATIGKVIFLGGTDIFDYCKFRNTVFDNFNFTHHNLILSDNNYNLHNWKGYEMSDSEYDESELTPEEIESTYLKAKNAAADSGDRKAAAEFFIKEMTFRRKKYTKIIKGNTRSLQDSNSLIEEDLSDKVSEFTKGGDLRTRLGAVGKWVGNWVLYQTCGYGERLWRVIYISGIVVVVFGILFATVTKGTSGVSNLATDGIDSVGTLLTPEGLVTVLKNIYFSMITFTTLGYGDIRPVGRTAGTLAGLESFIGALLLALVVFVLGRRVSW